MNNHCFYVDESTVLTNGNFSPVIVDEDGYCTETGWDFGPDLESALLDVEIRNTRMGLSIEEVDEMILVTVRQRDGSLGIN